MICLSSFSPLSQLIKYKNICNHFTLYWVEMLILLGIFCSEVVLPFWILGTQLWLPFSFVTAVGFCPISWDTLYFFVLTPVIQVLPGKTGPLWILTCSSIRETVGPVHNRAEELVTNDIEKEGWGTWCLLCFGLYLWHQPSGIPGP